MPNVYNDTRPIRRLYIDNGRTNFEILAAAMKKDEIAARNLCGFARIKYLSHTAGAIFASDEKERRFGL